MPTSSKGRSITVLPSLLCADMLNLRIAAAELEAMEFKALHVDIVERGFAPPTPLSEGLLALVREGLHTPLDVHIMSDDNEGAIGRLIGDDVYSMCFHAETTLQIDRQLRRIRRAGIRAGLALVPSTPLCALEYVVDLCDYVLLMLINPGYASEPDERMVEYAVRKVRDLRRFLDTRDRTDVWIEVDGRVSLEAIPGLIAAGADVLVAGSSCLFGHEGGLSAARSRIDEAIGRGITLWEGDRHLG